MILYNSLVHCLDNRYNTHNNVECRFWSMEIPFETLQSSDSVCIHLKIKLKQTKNYEPSVLLLVNSAQRRGMANQETGEKNFHKMLFMKKSKKHLR